MISASAARLAVAVLAPWLFAAVVSAQEAWTAVPSGTTQNLWSVAWGGNQFVAAGEGGTILSSPDGITWTPRVSGNTRWLVGVSHGNRLFVVVGDEGTILTSPDGIAWTGRASGTTARINGAAFGGGRWLAVAESGEVLSSTDALTWTKLQPSSDRLRGLTYAYGQFVITGDNGLMRVTIDTTDYDSRILPEGLFVESVVYARRNFLAVGEDGYAIASPDAITWQRVATRTTAYLRGVTFFNGQFIAVGDIGTVLTTADATGAWSPRTVATFALLTAVTASDASAVAVGFGGTIIRSAPDAAAPVLAAAPGDRVAAAGDNVLFTVTATGSLPLAFQWSFNGQSLAGQTGDRLLLGNVQSAQAGAYTVTVTNARGFVTSPPAALTLVATTAPGPIVDPTFNPDIGNVTAPLDSMVEQADGKVIVCYPGTGPDSAVARLNVDGSRDASFNLGTGIRGSVRLLVLQPDGRVLLSGVFTAIDGLARPGLARLNVDGSVDSLFAPPSVIAPPTLSSLPQNGDVALQADGKVLVLAGGSLYRLNNDGSLDSSFASTVTATLVAPLRNGQVVAGTSTNLDLLNPNGTRNSSIAATTSPAFFRGLSLLPGGGVLVEQLRSVRLGIGVSDQTYLLFRLGADGQRDSAWPGISIRGGFSLSHRYAAAPDGKIIRFHSEGSNRVIQRFNSDASVDYTFDMRRGPDSTVFGLLPLRDGRTLVTGSFNSFDGVSRPRLVRLVASNAPPRQGPVIVSVTPEAAAVRPGDVVTLSVAAAGSGPLTCQWSDAIPAADRAKTTVQVPTTLSGIYNITVTVTNSVGTTTSAPIPIAVAPSLPIITIQPASVSASIGRSAVFTVGAGGTAPFTYQWFRGTTLLDTSVTLTLNHVTSADAGDYTVVVRNSLGITTSQIARLTVDGRPQLTNISTRATVGPAERALIAGFVISGVTTKNVLVRGIGPSLASFALSGLLPNPVLTLYDSSNRVIATNDNWDSSATPPSLFASLGAFGFSNGSADAALRISIAPGSYTATLTDTANRIGTGLVEIYEADNNTTRIINLSSRAFVGTDSSIGVAGIVVRGQDSGRFLIRGIGPALIPIGVVGALADPILVLTTAAGFTVASNDNWSTNINASEIASVTTQVGAFPLAAGSRDAALVVTLPPGNYTALVSGASNTSGVGLVEIYEVP